MEHSIWEQQVGQGSANGLLSMYFDLLKGDEMGTNGSIDHVYWAFSSSAQSISAFIAFILTGYALVHNMMEGARQRDDTLEEVHFALSVAYHKKLARLAWLTGIAIVSDLVLVFFTRAGCDVNIYAILFASFLNVSAIFFGIKFVIQIVNPEKYKKAAKEELREESIGKSQDVMPVSNFFDAFVSLEKIVRDYVYNNNLSIGYKNTSNANFSFRQMIETLLYGEVIDSNLYNELLSINKYRNLVFHGHVESVDVDMIRRVNEVVRKIQAQFQNTANR